MPSFKSSGPHLPTHKLTHLERLYLYDYKAMEYIVKQTGRPRVVRGDGTDKYDLVLKWIEQDQLIVNGCASDYASTPGEDGLKPQSKEWNRFHARRDNAMKDLRKAIQAGWTLAQAWAAQPKPVKRRKKDTSARSESTLNINYRTIPSNTSIDVSNTVDNESSEEESETATSKDIQAMKNLTKSQLISELKRWNVSHPGVRNLGPLQELWEEQYRARQQKQFDEGRNAQRNHTNKGADEKVASDPVPKKTTVSGTKKRKRKANDNEQVDHKRAKVGMADWLEKNVDAQMTKTDDDIDVGTPHPQKRTIAMRKLPNRADISTRNAANKSALKSTLSRGPKSKQANSMDPSGSDENLPRRGEHLEIGDSGVDIPGNKECNVQGVESPATRRSTRSRSTTTVPMTTQRATHPTAAHKRRSAQIVIDEEYEAVNSDEKVRTFT